MNFRFFFSLFFLLVALRLDAGLVRVISVVDAQTLIIERAGVATNIKLAGVTIVDDEGARTLLQWALADRWVMLEEQASGGAFVYRSPDALFVNRELVSRGFARATLPDLEPQQHAIVTYLGTIRTNAVAKTAAVTTASPKARGTGSGTTPSSPARPSRRRRSPKP